MDLSVKYSDGHLDKDVGILTTETTLEQHGDDVTIREVSLENERETGRWEQTWHIAAVHEALGLVELGDDPQQSIFFNFRSRRLAGEARELELPLVVSRAEMFDDAALAAMARRTVAFGAVIAPGFALAVPDRWVWSEPVPYPNQQGWRAQELLLGAAGVGAGGAGPGPGSAAWSLRCERRQPEVGDDVLVVMTLGGLTAPDHGHSIASTYMRTPAFFWFRCHPLRHAALRALAGLP